MKGGTMQDIIIDTDIGDDIDDALAIAFALNHPEINVKAITTVWRDTKNRARLVLKLLKAFNKENIPVAAGIRKPLLGKEQIASINQLVVIEEKEDLPEPSNQNAVDVIISQVMSHKNLTVVTIGPLTNLALAIIKEPEIIKKTKLVMMGGVFTRQGAEYNVSCDPEAVKIILESGMKIIMAGLDVTLKCRLTQKELNNIADRDLPSTKLLVKMIRAWQKATKYTFPVLHDPLAVAVALDPTIVKMEPRKVNIETRGEFTRGFTVASKSATPNAQICVDVDVDRFITLFMEQILRETLRR